MTDDHYMALAFREAARAAGRTHPNPAVGCIVSRGGVVVGRGCTQTPPGPHAEVVALQEAGPLARGATLYVTLEPCNHHGRTPPCVQAILEAGIARVVAAVRDPFAPAAGGLEALERAGVATCAGVLEEQAERWLAPFLHWARTGRPYVVLKAAMTLDGKIASASGESKWITGPVARARVHRMRARLGAVMVGSRTALADDPELTVRVANGRYPQPTRIVADSRLRLPLSSRLVQSAARARLIVAASPEADPARAEALVAAGAVVLSVPAQDGKPDFAILMEELGKRGVTGILLEGGGEIAFSALESGCVNEVMYFVAPKLLGGASAPTPLGGAGYASPDAAVSVHLEGVRRCGRDILIRGRVGGR
ncbi:MAG TPA: bifunctional diaminohydroxyphosphoribosylaminopyrimidine deaminase/5-amino-6-(5-phosphoribosylamino)uracil reductase RibD [Armatimonadota bacterium]|jgi:diaminohydroxyphosphoribosylaminopyrimidine deaminase/5-amino-6-(5-phosphoribosylamino)uracil reductase